MDSESHIEPTLDVAKAMTLDPVTLLQMDFSQDVEICVSAESPAMVVELSSSPISGIHM